jgi:hypothetical protein
MSVRLLTVKRQYGNWKGIKPSIYLCGRWLEQAGFKPEHKVQVQLLAPGILELRFQEQPRRLQTLDDREKR